MTVQIEELNLNPALFEGVAAFNEAVWDFPQDRAFLHWLLVQAPNASVLVAHEDGRWISALGVFCRTYQHSSGPVDCLETYAWASIRDKSTPGIGRKLLEAMIARGKPLVALGGSVHTVRYMPELGYKIIAQAPALNLPLSQDAAKHIDGVKGRLIRIGIKVAARILKPSPKLKGGIRSVPIVRLDEAILRMPTLPGFQSTYTAQTMEWLTAGYPEVGTFIPYRFMRDQELVGWALGRVAEESGKVMVGRLLEFKFGPDTSPDDHLAMMRYVVASLAGFGVAIVRSLTTCPDINAALRALRFIAREVAPAIVYPAGLSFDNQAIRLSAIRADGGVLPLPTREELRHRTNSWAARR